MTVRPTNDRRRRDLVAGSLGALGATALLLVARGTPFDVEGYGLKVKVHGTQQQLVGTLVQMNARLTLIEEALRNSPSRPLPTPSATP
jgi:hypothetical protein